MSYAIEPVDDTGKTSGVTKNVERAQFQIDEPTTGQVYAAPNTNNQTQDNRCTDIHVTVAPRSETIVSTPISATDVNNKNILILKQEIIKKMFTVQVLLIM